VGGAPVSAVKVDSSSFELMREATSPQFLFNLHIFWDEGDAGKLLQGMVAMCVVFLSAPGRNQSYENLCIC